MHMRLSLRTTVVAGAAAGLLAGGLFNAAAASNACTENGKNETPVVTQTIHDNEALIDSVITPYTGKTTHDDVEPLTCLP